MDNPLIGQVDELVSDITRVGRRQIIGTFYSATDNLCKRFPLLSRRVYIS